VKRSVTFSTLFAFIFIDRIKLIGLLSFFAVPSILQRARRRKDRSTLTGIWILVNPKPHSLISHADRFGYLFHFYFFLPTALQNTYILRCTLYYTSTHFQWTGSPFIVFCFIFFLSSVPHLCHYFFFFFAADLFSSL
jgi:hypothetical protein